MFQIKEITTHWKETRHASVLNPTLDMLANIRALARRSGSIAMFDQVRARKVYLFSLKFNCSTGMDSVTTSRDAVFSRTC